MEHAPRRIIHVNVTSHPTAAWTLQQLREAIPWDHTYRFMLGRGPVSVWTEYISAVCLY